MPSQVTMLARRGLNFPMASGHACPSAANSYSFGSINRERPGRTPAPLLIIVAFFFLVLRPARARQREFLKVQSELAPGARVMIASGIFGEIVSVGDDTIELRIAADTVVTVKRQAVARVIPADRLRPRPRPSGH